MTSNTLTDREALYCLCHVPGFGGVTIRGLKDTFGTYLSAWRVKPQELQKSGVLTERRVEVFQESRKHESAWRKEFAGLAQKNIRVIAECDPDYPTRFLPYKDRPAVLFVKGSLPENEVPSVAIVGARSCTEYGKEAAGFYAGELANAGVNIISGMAAGVDGYAHRGAIERGKPTYAVLGCGVNVCYPRENYKIFHAMEENGGILSEFVPGTRPAAMNFPMRNRIISGLSDVVAVVEARYGSGSLITADYALEQGRSVMAVPGRLDDELSRGCNALIAQGAGVILSAESFCEQIFPDYRQQKKRKALHITLAPSEKLVYSSLGLHSKSLWELLECTSLSPAELSGCLLSLEQKGLAREVERNYYVKV